MQTEVTDTPYFDRPWPLLAASESRNLRVCRVKHPFFKQRCLNLSKSLVPPLRFK